MVRVRGAVAGVGMGVFVLALAGCNNPDKARIAELEEANARLVSDLNALQQQLEEARRQAQQAVPNAGGSASETVPEGGTLSERVDDASLPEGWQGGPGSIWTSLYSFTKRNCMLLLYVSITR